MYYEKMLERQHRNLINLENALRAMPERLSGFIFRNGHMHAHDGVWLIAFYKGGWEPALQMFSDAGFEITEDKEVECEAPWRSVHFSLNGEDAIHIQIHHNKDCELELVEQKVVNTYRIKC